MNRSVKRTSPSSDPVDAHVGRRVKRRRNLLDMSQSALADKIGLTFQQIQKYERGTNRISASRLFELSQVLDVPVSFFFDDMPEEIASTRPAPTPDDPMAKREVLDMVRAYHAISDAGVRKSLFDMIKVVTKPGGDPTDSG